MLSNLVLLLKLLYIASGLKALITRWQAEREGAEKQQLKDMGHELETLDRKAKVDSAVARQSDADLRSGVLADSRDTDR